MTGKLLLLHGVPGSGKSTFTERYLREHPEEQVVVVNRDSMRSELFGEEYHSRKPDQASEAAVTELQEERLRAALEAGATVIDDNTNLNPRFMGKTVALARSLGAEIEQEYMDVPPEECHRRNRARGAAGGRLVPEEVLASMVEAAYDSEGHLKEMILGEERCFLVPRVTSGGRLVEAFNRQAAFREPLADGAVVLVDVDGTLASNAHFAAYYLNRRGAKKDFNSFFKSLEHSEVNEGVRDLANRMRAEEGLGLVVLTGRDDGHARELLSFVRRSGLRVSRVVCKRKGDFRPDREFKAEAIRKLREEGLVPVHALDDRPASVAVMEREGILVSRVAVPEHSFTAEDPVPSGSYPQPEVTTVFGSGRCLRCGQPLKSGNLGPKCRLK